MAERGSHTDYIRWVPGLRAMKLTSLLHRTAYRLTRGWLGGHVDGLDILLLTTRGRRSGRPRTAPLPYFHLPDVRPSHLGERDLVLVASFGGGDRDPAWVRNLEVEPEAGVQVRGRSGRHRARILRGPARKELWEEIARAHPRYLDYQSRTEREIPLVALEGAADLLPPG